MFQVLVIDPYAREVRRQWVTGKLDDYYDAIGKGCTTFQAAYPDGVDNDDCFYIDEEGKNDERQTAGFIFGGWLHDILVGRVLVIGTKDTGASTAAATHIDDIAKQITWLSDDEFNRVMERYR